MPWPSGLLERKDKNKAGSFFGLNFDAFINLAQRNKKQRRPRHEKIIAAGRKWEMLVAIKLSENERQCKKSEHLQEHIHYFLQTTYN